jgi:hypothetical protein
MTHTVIAAVLVGHGLITSAVGFGALSNPNAPAMALPSWFAWWPGPFGRSWLFDALGLGTAFSVIGGLLWLTAGLLLVAGGLGWFGVGFLEGIRVPLLVAGGVIGLVALGLYFHPIYVAAVAINLAIVVLLWSQLSAAQGTA